MFRRQIHQTFSDCDQRLPEGRLAATFQALWLFKRYNFEKIQCQHQQQDSAHLPYKVSYKGLLRLQAEANPHKLKRVINNLDVLTSCSNLFQPKIEYLPDPYERKDQLRRQERQDSLTKIIKNSHRFYDHGALDSKGLFSSPREGNYPQNSPKQYTIQEKKSPLFGPFKPNNPAKRGYNNTFNAYPKYLEAKDNQIESPESLKDRLLTRNNIEKKWIPNNFKWTKPCTSIQDIPKNVNRDNQKIF